MAFNLLFEEIQEIIQRIFYRTLGFKPRRNTIHIVSAMYYPEGSNQLNWVAFMIKDIAYLIDWETKTILHIILILHLMGGINMKNLLEETLEILKENGKTPDDVRYVCKYPLMTDWKHFELNANFIYDNGYGFQEINCTLMIVGDGWWMERWDYDGSEGWEFKNNPNSGGLRIAHPHEIMKMIKY